MADNEQIKIPGTESDPADAEDIIKRLPVVQFTMDYLRDPDDALVQWGRSTDMILKHTARRFIDLALKAAERTGVPLEEILDKDTRTPEMQQLLLELSAEEMQIRFYDYTNSRYIQAIVAVTRLKGKYPDPNDTDPTSDHISVKEQTALYYFALHKEIDPASVEKLTETQIDEIVAIFWKLDEYYFELTNGDPDKDTITWETFFEFIRRENPEPGAAETIAAQLETIQGITPSYHTMPNNTLMNKLQQKGVITAEPFDLTVMPAKGKQKEITTYNVVTFDPGDTGITITNANLTEYERQVSDAIISIFVTAKEQDKKAVFNADTVYRAMPGGGERAMPQQRKAIEAAIEKFRHLRIYVDATEEMTRRGIDLKGGKFEFDEYYLHVRRYTYKVKNGTTVYGYEILSQPVMYTYSQLTKQILTTSADNILLREVENGRILDTPIKMTADRQALTGYMLRRILVIKRDTEDAREKLRKYNIKRKQAQKNGDNMEEKTLDDFRTQTPVILFDTMFTETDTATTNRAQARRNREFCISALEFWKAKGLIKGYCLRRSGQAYTAIELTF